VRQVGQASSVQPSPPAGAAAETAGDGSANSFMRNHPTGIERFNYLQGEVAKCQSWQSQQPETTAPITTETTTTQSAGLLTADSSSTAKAQFLWKSVQDPNLRWKFKIGDQFVYGELFLPEERHKMGDFFTVDVKKRGDKFIGTQRVRGTLKISDNSPQGFYYKPCQWEFAVELETVTNERIEGRWEGYAPDSKADPLTCIWQGERIWQDVRTLLHVSGVAP